MVSISLIKVVIIGLRSLDMVKSNPPTRVVKFRRNMAKCFIEESQIVSTVCVVPFRRIAHERVKPLLVVRYCLEHVFILLHNLDAHSHHLWKVHPVYGIKSHRVFLLCLLNQPLYICIY